ncbi:hypothetical protein VULLAG_LOCUS93 [Vulpes lagopus]
MGKMATSPTPLHRPRLNNGIVCERRSSAVENQVSLEVEGSPFPLASWEDDDPQDEFTNSMVTIGRIYVNLSFYGLMEGLLLLFSCSVLLG